jgi:predicted Rdx family selenoprotein
VWCDCVLSFGELVYSKKATGKFPEFSDLKALFREKIAPQAVKAHQYLVP